MGMSRPSITDDSGNLTSGTIFNAAFFTDIFDKIDAYVDGTITTGYDFAWTASVPPTLGNGTKSGVWFKQGRMLFWQYSLSMGSTTTFGTGLWAFGLPVSVGSTAGGVALILDSSAGQYYLGTVQLATGTTFNVITHGTTAGGLAPAVPFTWATSDTIAIAGYSAAS